MPLSPRRYKLEVTLDQQAHDQLRQLQDLLAHQIPNGDPAVIVKRAIELLLAETLKKKTAKTERPRRPGTPRGQCMRSSRAIPAQLKRQVWERDEGRCGFVGEEGSRCNEMRGLEYAHVRPGARAANIVSIISACAAGRAMRTRPLRTMGRNSCRRSTGRGSASTA